MNARNPDFQERLKKSGAHALPEAVTAVLALLVCLTPLKTWLAGPGYWVLADVSAAIFILVMLMGW